MSGWLYRNTVLRFAPRFALSQIRARRRAELLMNYDGASRGPRTKSFRQPATDADAASFGARKILRQRSRDLIRNRPFITRAQAVVSSNVVAKGIMPRIHIEGGNDAQQKKLSGLLTTHMLTAGIDAYGELALPSLQRVVMNGVFESGEVFVRRRMRDKRDRTSNCRFRLKFWNPIGSMIRAGHMVLTRSRTASSMTMRVARWPIGFIPATPARSIAWRGAIASG